MKTTVILAALLALAVMPAVSQQTHLIYGGRSHAAGAHLIKPTPKLVNGYYNSDSVFAQIADGGGWITRVTVVNLSRITSAAFTLDFFSNTGGPQPFTWTTQDLTPGEGAYASLYGSIEPGGSRTFVTANVGTPDGTNEGYAEFVATSDQYTTSPNISGYAVFVNTANGNEATVPLEASNNGNQLIAWNETNGYGMGVAFVNVTGGPITANIYAFDESGTLQASVNDFSLPGGYHSAVDFTQLFPGHNLTGLNGTMFIEPSRQGLSVLGIQYTPAGGFTSVSALAEE